MTRHHRPAAPTADQWPSAREQAIQAGLIVPTAICAERLRGGVVCFLSPGHPGMHADADGSLRSLDAA